MAKVQLLSTKQMCRKLGGMNRAVLAQIEPQLLARGAKFLGVGKKKLWDESTVDAVIRDLIEREIRLTTKGKAAFAKKE